MWDDQPARGYKILLIYAIEILWAWVFSPRRQHVKRNPFSRYRKTNIEDQAAQTKSSREIVKLKFKEC